MSCLGVVPYTQAATAFQQHQKYQYRHQAGRKAQRGGGPKPGARQQPTLPPSTLRSPRRTTDASVPFDHATPEQS